MAQTSPQMSLETVEAPHLSFIFSGRIMLSRSLCIRHFDSEIDPLPLRSLLLAIGAIASPIMIGGALFGFPRSVAAELPWVVPD
jgi:hypothetical protein